MSTSYEILRFSHPTEEELKALDIEIFSSYDRYTLKDEDDEYCPNEFIKLFRLDDPYAANLCGTQFVRPMRLPRIETDYEKMYRSMGFSEEDIKNKQITLVYGRSGWGYEYTNGVDKRRIGIEQMKKFDYEIPTSCFAIKMKTLWDSSEAYVYPDHELVDKYIPDIDKYHYVPVNNTILSRAEIPFLIFERNKGKCFMQRD